jgi:rod shape-determining protein MreC
MFLYHFIMRENDSLRAQNAALLNKVLVYKGLEVQSQRLRRVLDFAAMQPKRYIPAQVIGFDTSNAASSITIDKGRSSGVVVGCPVVTHLGLVGQVVEITSFSSRVLLISDPNLAVACRLLETRDLGLVSGGLSRNLKMQYLAADADVASDGVVVTAGIKVGKITSVYPEGIPVGVVVDVVNNPGMQTKTAYVKPFVNFGALEEVLVIR